MIRLGLNIDHVATVRNARGGGHPDPVRAALMAEKIGIDGITAHLREDRRHITDKDITALKEKLSIPLNLEMAATTEMRDIALKHLPHAVCLVPEKREEKTTEGGLDLLKEKNNLREYLKPLIETNIRLSAFIDPDLEQVKTAHALGFHVVEFHTGSYCHAVWDDHPEKVKSIYESLYKACEYAHSLGLEVHAGHGIDYQTVKEIIKLPFVKELNIGHFLIGEAIFCGLEQSVLKMRALMNDAV